MVNLHKEHISLIAAISKDRRALGNKNQLLWHLPGDLPRFKKITMGHPIIMGRKTFASIGKPLPGRTNIVVSNTMQTITGTVVCHSVEEALQRAAEEKTGETFIIGGAMLYEQTIAHADRLYLTIVEDEPEADVFFPDYSAFIVNEEESHTDLSPPFTYRTLIRKRVVV